MTEAEAYELALQHVIFAHELGEATISQGQFWAGVSYAILAIAFVAPHVLNRYTTPILLVLYMLFSLNISTNTEFDYTTSVASMKDAENLIEKYNLELTVFDEKNRHNVDADLGFRHAISIKYADGLFWGTLIIVCVQAFRQKKKPVTEDTA